MGIACRSLRSTTNKPTDSPIVVQQRGFAGLCPTPCRRLVIGFDADKLEWNEVGEKLAPLDG